MTGVKLVAVFSTTGLLATSTMSVDPLIKLALEAPIYGILLWTLAKTIPKITSDHREGLSEVASEVKAASERTNKLLEKAFNDITDSGCDVR